MIADVAIITGIFIGLFFSGFALGHTLLAFKKFIDMI